MAIRKRVFYLPCILVYVILHVLLPHNTNNESSNFSENCIKNSENAEEINPIEKGEDINESAKSQNMKHILIWPHMYPLDLLLEGQESFLINNCKHVNCYVTNDINYLNASKDFDAICFSGNSLRTIGKIPFIRSNKQKYVFASLDPAPKVPVTNPMFDNFFNWTWTYRLSSDISWRYITIFDPNNNTIGPAANLKWPKHTKPIDKKFRKSMSAKTKAVAWISSHCYTPVQVKTFVGRFKTELTKYGLSFDQYGKCGQFSCGVRRCSEMLRKDYFFYLVFENSLDEDYVTEKILMAVNNFVVPVVYGGASYSSFLHPGSYLNARELGPVKLAKTIKDVIKNLSLYYNFFRWRDYFRYLNSKSTTELCNICTALHDEEKMKPSIISNFRYWWNTPSRQRTYEYILRNFFVNQDLLTLASKHNGTRAGSLVLWQHIKNQTNISKEKFIYVYNLNLKSIPSANNTDSSFNENTETISFNFPTYHFNFTTDTTETYDPSLDVTNVADNIA